MDCIDSALTFFSQRDNIWKNPAFGTDFASTQSEGTYVTDIVVPLLWATLRRLLVGKINLLST